MSLIPGRCPNTLIIAQILMDPTVPEVLLSSDGQCPQLVSDHLRLWRAYSDLLTGVSQRDSLVTHSRCLIRLIQTVGGALDGLGGEANMRLGADHLIRGGGYGFYLVIKLFFSTPSLNVQFFSDTIKSKQFFFSEVKL